MALGCAGTGTNGSGSNTPSVPCQRAAHIHVQLHGVEFAAGRHRPWNAYPSIYIYIYVCMPDSILSPPLYGGVDRAALMERPAGGFDCVYNIMVLS